MNPYIVSARKYRPQTFDEVVGQKAITQTLINAIDNNHLAQALLFTGPRGVGKTSCARILARTINSNIQGEQTSKDLTQDFAFNIFELDAASNNSVDDIRTLIDQVRIPPQQGKYKVYIIDEVHMLSSSAFNAFLKTLEEPPSHAIFILATTEKHKIIPTVLSRCQIFDFKRITVTDARLYLEQICEIEGITADVDALQIIAQKADGAMRDALSIFDRVVSFCGKELTREAVTENLNVLDYQTYFTLTNQIIEGAIPEVLVHFDTILKKGFDPHHFIAGLASHFRDLLVARTSQTLGLLEVSDTLKDEYITQSQKASDTTWITAIELANTCDLQFKTTRNQRLLIELCLMKLASLFHEKSPVLKKKDSISIAFSSSVKSPEASTLSAEPSVKLKENATISKSEVISSVTSKQTPLAGEVSNDSLDENLIKPSLPDSLKQNQDIDLDKVSTPKDVLRPRSAFSLKSFEKKRKEELKQEAKQMPVSNDGMFPKNPFTESEVVALWKKYAQNQKDKGGQITAATISGYLPKLKDKYELYLELPNASMKEELEHISKPLLSFLHEKLQNYSITLTIIVKEELAKLEVFTPQEKYDKLKVINPSLELLRLKLDLDF